MNTHDKPERSDDPAVAPLTEQIEDNVLDETAGGTSIGCPEPHLSADLGNQGRFCSVTVECIQACG